MVQVAVGGGPRSASQQAARGVGGLFSRAACVYVIPTMVGQVWEVAASPFRIIHLSFD